MNTYHITLGEMHIVLSEVRCFEPYKHKSSAAYPSALHLFHSKYPANGERKRLEKRYVVQVFERSHAPGKIQSVHIDCSRCNEL